jgi:N6-adenosine-specific RNA methylase IME4
MTKYRTIVADPPWPLKDTGPRTASENGRWDTSGRGQAGRRSRLGYGRMSVEEIAALPVARVAESDSHLYLWTVNAFLEEAYDVARAWGFKPSTLLTWCKPPMGLGFGGTFANASEFIIFARRGSLPAKQRIDRTWFEWPRPYGRGPIHSAKPDAALDLIEQVSPGPYLEMFARRARFGWDYWGDQSLGTAEMVT